MASTPFLKRKAEAKQAARAQTKSPAKPHSFAEIFPTESGQGLGKVWGFLLLLLLLQVRPGGHSRHFQSRTPCPWLEISTHQVRTGRKHLVGGRASGHFGKGSATRRGTLVPQKVISGEILASLFCCSQAKVLWPLKELRRFVGHTLSWTANRIQDRRS